MLAAHVVANDPPACSDIRLVRKALGAVPKGPGPADPAPCRDQEPTVERGSVLEGRGIPNRELGASDLPR